MHLSTAVAVTVFPFAVIDTFLPQNGLPLEISPIIAANTNEYDHIINVQRKVLGSHHVGEQ